MPPIYLLIKPASGLCNLRCDYCFYCDEMENRQQQSYGIMSAATLETVVGKALAYADGTCGIAFQGGEPTLAGLEFYERLTRTQARHNKKRLRIYNSIQTNGVGLGREWAEYFSRNKFLVGLSLDGIKDTHDANRKSARGGGTFHDVMDTALLFDKNKVDYNILTVVNAQTAVNIGRIYRFYQRRGFRFLQFIPCLDPLSENPGNYKYSLTAELYGKFLCDLFDLWYADLMTGRHPFIRAFENYVGILCGIEPESCDMRGICSCQYVVEADGSVFPCDFYALDDMRLGNLLTDDFPDLDKRRQELGFVARSVKLPESCSCCQWVNLCRGGCMRHRVFEGSLLQNRFCLSFKAFFAHAHERLNEIAKALKT